jgi:hypothetical protein
MYFFPICLQKSCHNDIVCFHQSIAAYINFYKDNWKKGRRKQMQRGHPQCMFKVEHDNVYINWLNHFGIKGCASYSVITICTFTA